MNVLRQIYLHTGDLILSGRQQPVNLCRRLGVRGSMGPNILPIYKGHFVDARLKQFHLWKMGELPRIILFDSKKGKKWLAEMRQKGLSMGSVPVESPEGQKRLEEFKKLNVFGSE